jgi:hypothetical protein
MKNWSFFLSVFLALTLSFQAVLVAQPIQSHVIPLEEARERLIENSSRRLMQIQEIQRLLHHDRLPAEVGELFDLHRVDLALAGLDERSLEELASQSRELNDQIEASVSKGTWVTIAVIVGVVAVVLALSSGTEECGCC